MRVKAYVIKTALSKASSEEGKFSASFTKENTLLLVHADDIATWNYKEGMSVRCINQELGFNVVLAVKASRFVRKGTVNIINSPWLLLWIAYNLRSMDLDIEPTNDQPNSLETIYNSILERSI